MTLEESTAIPKEFKPKASHATWVWHTSGTLDEWHIRTTTEALPHRFSGLIWSDGGSVVSVTPMRDENKDRVRQQGNEISYDFSTKADQDGLDFHLKGAKCVVFHLHEDQKPDPQRVFVGKDNHHPKTPVFSVCAK
jgi:hypothetical protein